MRITSTPINANSKPRHSIPDFLTTDHADKYRILRPPPPCSSVIIWYGSVASVVEIFVSQTSVGSVRHSPACGTTEEASREGWATRPLSSVSSDCSFPGPSGAPMSVTLLFHFRATRWPAERPSPRSTRFVQHSLRLRSGPEFTKRAH